MLIFLAISTVLAALAPRPIDSDRETTTTGVTRETTGPVPGGEPEHGALVRRRISIGDEGGGPIPTVNVSAGDQLVLTVRAARPLTLESTSLGITETTGPDDPARLDLLLTDPGRHSIVDSESGRRLVRIVVGSGEGAG